MKHAPHICAACGRDIWTDPPQRAPFGKDGAMVKVCDACNSDAPLPVATVTNRGYETPPASDAGQMAEKISRIAKRTGAATARGYLANEMIQARTPGWTLRRLERVKNARGGSMDSEEAMRMVADQPWAKLPGARYLGMTVRFVLFEHPPESSRPIADQRALGTDALTRGKEEA